MNPMFLATAATLCLAATACTFTTSPGVVRTDPVVVQAPAPRVTVVPAYQDLDLRVETPRVFVRPEWEHDDHRWNNGRRWHRWDEDRRYDRDRFGR